MRSSRLATPLVVFSFVLSTVGVAQRALASPPGLVVEIEDRSASHPMARGSWSWLQEAKISPSDGLARSEFGAAVAVDGDTAAVGAHWDDDLGTRSGSVYVYVRAGTTWSLQQKITAPDGMPIDNFGTSVAIEGDTILAGAVTDDDHGQSSGSVYVFERTGTTWGMTQKLTAADGSAGDYFGVTLALDGDRAVVGAWGDEVTGPFSGSAYVFARAGSTWSQQAKLVSSDSAHHDRFGYSVAIDDDRLVVGAIDADVVAEGSGAAYVFAWDGSSWAQEAELTGTPGESGGNYACSVAIAGDTVLVGSSTNEELGMNAGAVYLYERIDSTWTASGWLLSGDTTWGDWYGSSVMFDGERAVVGAVYESTFGAVYVFEREGSTWNPPAKLTPPDGADMDLFGNYVSLSGDTVLVGAFWDDDQGEDSGSVYLFTYTASASATFRNDAGSTNPTGYTASPPILGEDWIATVDNTGTGNFVAGVLGFQDPLEAYLPGAGGFLLVDPLSAGGELLGLPPAFGYGPVTFTAPIPEDASLLGFAFSTQGAGLGGAAGATLHNAFDLFAGR